MDATPCPVGTIDENGTCSPAVLQTGGSPCGPGTHMDELLLACVPDLPPTVCDIASTVAEIGPDGVTVCVSSGTCDSGCEAPIACPSPVAGKVTLCGRLLDTETQQPIAAPDATGATCTATTADGPCSTSFAVFDALAFAADPSSQPLSPDDIVVDDCGRFRVTNSPLPFNKALGLAVDDAGDDDQRALTGIALFADPGQRITGLRAFTTRRATDAAWTASAGDPFAGQTFAERGVLAAIFGDDAAPPNPVAGVTPLSAGSARPDDTYCFADSDEQLTSPRPELDVTGANGACLMTGSALNQHGGTGGLSPGCEWPSTLAASIPGVILVVEKTPECP